MNFDFPLEDCSEFSNFVITLIAGPVKVVVLNNIKVVTEALITKKADFANRPQSVSSEY